VKALKLNRCFDMELPIDVRVREKARERGYRLRKWGRSGTHFTLIDNTSKARISIGDEVLLSLEKIEQWLDRELLWRTVPNRSLPSSDGRVGIACLRRPLFLLLLHGACLDPLSL
jgi:hypothetical protein